MKRHTIYGSMGRAWKPIRYLSQLFMRWPWRTLQDWEWGHKSCRRTPQLLPVSACGKDIEMFSIATTETLSLEVFVLLFCLLWGFVNVSLSNKLLAACTFSCFWKVNPQHRLLHRKATLQEANNKPVYWFQLISKSEMYDLCSSLDSKNGL